MHPFRSTLTIALLLARTVLSAQDRPAVAEGTVRGTVVDLDTHQPLFGATVVVVGSEPLLGGTTDMDGRFVIADVPAGRIDLDVRMLGHEEQRLQNILVNTAKETVLELRLQESIVQMQEVEVTNARRKGELRNDMVLLSGREISVEETSRIAGGINDPARMVSTFPGVAGDPAGDNTIIVRGNSPKGVLWRMEGVEIPNPNHFSEEGSTGGPINVLNSDVIDNSEFYTGAFTAEYGNATSAVFDMRLRKGNDHKREYTLKAGVLGTDLTAEGPLGAQGGSYLVNYRYSTLALLDQAGIVDYQGVPKYTDGAFHVHLPTGRAGTFSLFGLGGLSHILQEDRGVVEDTLFSRADFGSYMGVAGLTHTLLIGKNNYLYSTVSLSGNGSSTDYKEDPAPGEGALEDRAIDALDKWTVRGTTVLNTRLNERLKVRNGIIVSVENYRMHGQSWEPDAQRLVTQLDSRGAATTLQAFTSWKYRWTERWTVTGGLHALHYALNGSTSIEPRMAVRWQPRPERAISLGAGLHSRTETIMTYLAQDVDADGTTYRPNADLGLSRAAHIVLGYEQQLAEDVQLKVEAYHQYLYDLPVENDPNSSFCLANYDGWFTTRDLVNKGTGHNTGLELSVEKFFTHGWHALATASVSSAEYKALDGHWHHSRFDLGVVGNVLAGKEWKLGRAGRDRVLTTGFRYSVVGGQYRTPIDLAASQAAGEEVDAPSAWSEKGDAVHKLDVVIAYREGRPKTSHEIKVDVQNVLGGSTTVYQDYDRTKQRIVDVPQLGLLPVLQYTLRF